MDRDAMRNEFYAACNKLGAKIDSEAVSMSKIGRYITLVFNKYEILMSKTKEAIDLCQKSGNYQALEAIHEEQGVIDTALNNCKVWVDNYGEMQRNKPVKQDESETLSAPLRREKGASPTKRELFLLKQKREAAKLVKRARDTLALVLKRQFSLNTQVDLELFEATK